MPEHAATYDSLQPNSLYPTTPQSPHVSPDQYVDNVPSHALVLDNVPMKPGHQLDVDAPLKVIEVGFLIVAVESDEDLVNEIIVEHPAELDIVESEAFELDDLHPFSAGKLHGTQENCLVKFVAAILELRGIPSQPLSFL